jgi:CRISPR system Cascade subunit CasB
MTPSSPSRQVSIGAHAFTWWRQHCSPEKGDPGVRARLRRCRSPLEAALIPESIGLARRLGALGPGAHADDAAVSRALDLTRVLAHVKKNVSIAPMRAAGWKWFPADRKESDAGNDRPRLAESRFHRLLQAEDGEERVAAFTRLIALLGAETDIGRIAEDFWHWNDRTRQRWAFEYFAAAAVISNEGTTTLEENEA